MKKYAVVLTIAIVLLMFIGQTFAQPSLTLDRYKIGLNEKVKITITSNMDGTTVDKITVIFDSGGPDEKSFVKDYDPDKTANNGEKLEEYFGTGVPGWSPDADTSKEGWYKIIVEGTEPNSNPGPTAIYFDVSRRWYVPEFGVASVVATAIGFALFTVIRRKIGRK